MDQQEFEQSVSADLRRSLLIGRCSEEIRRAEEALRQAPAEFPGTKRMLAHTNLHRWMAKREAAERGLVL